MPSPRDIGERQGAIEQGAQYRGFERLLDIPEGSRFDGGHGALFAPFASDDDGGDVTEFLA